MKSSVRSFLLGLGVSALILTSFFAGALADRVFGIKPLDYLLGSQTSFLNYSKNKSSEETSLSQLIDDSHGLSVPDVVDAASQSVLTVSIKKQQRVVSPLSGGIFNFGPFGLSVPDSSQVEEVQQDIGTGFVVAEDGLVVTNKHVVADLQAEYKVYDKNDQEYPVSKIYRDPTNDLAILQVEGLQAPALPLGDSSNLRVGESVIAIGTALGEFRHTVTTGVISGLGRGITAGDGLSQFEDLEDVIQTDAAINPGNSGGPLISSQGQVIGVNVAVTQGAENIGFAIPINVVKASIDNFNQTGQFERPMLGVKYRMISQQAALLNEVPQGAYLVEVVGGSSAEVAGLKQGDIIISIDQKDLKDQDLAEILNTKKIGDEVEIRYFRNGEEKTIKVKLQSVDNSK